MSGVRLKKRILQAKKGWHFLHEKWSGAWIRNRCQNFSCNVSLSDPFSSLTTHALSSLISPTFFVPIEYSCLFTPLHLYHIALLLALILYYFPVLWTSFTWRKINQKSRNRKLSLSRVRWWPTLLLHFKQIFQIEITAMRISFINSLHFKLGKMGEGILVFSLHFSFVMFPFSEVGND